MFATTVFVSSEMTLTPLDPTPVTKISPVPLLNATHGRYIPMMMPCNGAFPGRESPIRVMGMFATRVFVSSEMTLTVFLE